MVTLSVCSDKAYPYLKRANDELTVLFLHLQGGDVVQETISANVTDDTVSLEFQRPDGTLVTQLIDFRNVSQHYKLTSFVFLLFRLTFCRPFFFVKCPRKIFSSRGPEFI